MVWGSVLHPTRFVWKDINWGTAHLSSSALFNKKCSKLHWGHLCGVTSGFASRGDIFSQLTICLTYHQMASRSKPNLGLDRPHSQLESGDVDMWSPRSRVTTLWRGAQYIPPGWLAILRPMRHRVSTRWRHASKHPSHLIAMHLAKKDRSSRRRNSARRLIHLKPPKTGAANRHQLETFPYSVSHSYCSLCLPG